MSTEAPIRKRLAVFKKAGLKLRANFLLTKQFQCALDLLVLSGALMLAYLLRFDFALPRAEISNALSQLPYVLVFQFIALRMAGVHTFIWRYVGLTEMKSFISAALWAALPLLVLRFCLPDEAATLRVPVSIILLDSGLSFIALVSMRLVRRGLYEQKRRRGNRGDNVPRKSVLLIGAGLAGQLTAKEILSCAEMDLHIRGFVDDDPLKQGASIQDIKVLGTTQDLPRLVEELRIDHVIISIAHATREDFRRILNVCEQIPVRVRVIPSLDEILKGRVTVSRIRDLQVEDLLGREQVQLDDHNLQRLLKGRAVMITGAGGSIGSELARQALRFNPANLILVERAESSLFNIERELSEQCSGETLTAVVADIGDESRMREVFNRYRPEVVLHAAAHKHVPMMEFNVSEAIKNNTLATNLLGELSGSFGVDVFVLISTDKAVRPSSVMGASKRLAEIVIQNLNRRFATRFVAVRFGNVLGSAGSVIPIFREQIRKGGPVTVTDPEMRRYFMTIPEAAQLVLEAGAMGKGGEIFILDMGEPVRILELAEETIRLSGLAPYEDVDIVFTGLRPGEKLFEELETSGEKIFRTRHPKIFVGKIASYPTERVHHALEHLRVLADSGWDREIRRTLSDLLPEAQLHLPEKDLGQQRADERKEALAMIGT